MTTETTYKTIIDATESGDFEKAYDLMFQDEDLSFIMDAEDMTAPQLLERIIHDCKQAGEAA